MFLDLPVHLVLLEKTDGLVYLVDLDPPAELDPLESWDLQDDRGEMDFQGLLAQKVKLEILVLTASLVKMDLMALQALNLGQWDRKDL